jgi:hypothetical protein
MNQFLPSPRVIPLGPFRIFSKIRGDIRKSRCTTGINDTGGKLCHRCQGHRRQICHRYQRHRRQTLPPFSLVALTSVANFPPVSTIPAAGVVDTGGNLPPVSTTPAANLPPVSMTLVANNWNNIRLLRLKVNLKAKMFLYVYSTSQRCTN